MGESQAPQSLSDLLGVKLPATVGSGYCRTCSAENRAGRGACVMCYRRLSADSGGMTCPLCTHDNPKEAQYCGGCGSPLMPGLSRLPTLIELATQVLHGAGAEPAGEYEEGYEDEYAEEEYAEEYGEDSGLLAGAPVLDEAPQPLAAPAPVAAPAPAPAPMAAPPPSPILSTSSTALPADAVAEALSEDELGMPPSALDIQEPIYTPPPVPAAAADEEMLPAPDDSELFAAPAPAYQPPSVAEAEAEQADLYEEAGPPVEDDDFVAPPAVPKGMSSVVDEDVVFESLAAVPEIAPEALAPVETAPEPEPEPQAPPPAPKPAASSSDDDDFGDWSLEVPGE
jgi:hypothetical protein